LKFFNYLSFQIEAGIIVFILPCIHNVSNFVQLFMINSIWESFNLLKEISNIFKPDMVIKSGVGMEFKF
jgi:hypothetical protein